MSDLAAALAALSTGKKDEAQAALIRAWQKRRSPELAAFVDALGASPFVVSARVAATLQRLRALDADDPRLGTSLLSWLVAPPFAGASSEPFWKWAMDAAVALGDPRLLGVEQRARAMIKRRLSPLSVRRTAEAGLDRAVAAVRTPRAPSAADATLEAKIAAQLAPHMAAQKSEAELLAAIYAEPHLDGPRLVYADFLQERGHPRGEFIALQFKRRDHGLDASESAREEFLLKQHGKEWLGGLAAVMSFAKGYSHTQFERGFLAVADIQLSADRKLPLTWDDPNWATVETFNGLFAAVVFEKGPRLPGLRRAEVSGTAALAALARSAHRAPRLDTVEIQGWVEPAARWLAALDEIELPALRELVASFHPFDPATVEAILTKPVCRRLEVLRVGAGSANQGTAELATLAKKLVGTDAPVPLLVLYQRGRPAVVELRRGRDGKFR